MPRPAEPPRARIDDAGRDRLLGLLREHYARGRLDDGELDRRAGLVLAAEFADEAAAAVADLTQPAGRAGGPEQVGGPAPAGASRRSWRPRRRGHAQAASPGPAWVPTGERFRDPSSKTIMRVWIDPADDSRHYVPEPEG